MKILLFSLLTFVMTAQMSFANEGSKGHSKQTESIRVIREVR